MRKQIRKPATERAQMLALRKLWRMKELGHDPNNILDQSTMNCWQDLYEPREQITQMETSGPWALFRDCIRNQRTTEDQSVMKVINQMGGLHNLGGRSSKDLDFLRKDFDAHFKQARH